MSLEGAEAGACGDGGEGRRRERVADRRADAVQEIGPDEGLALELDLRDVAGVDRQPRVGAEAIGEQPRVEPIGDPVVEEASMKANRSGSRVWARLKSWRMS